MEKRSDILFELQFISPTLAELAPVNPYAMPEGYFESLASNLLLLVKEDTYSTVLGENRQMPYQVPSKYFDKLPEQILSLVTSDKVPARLPAKPGNPYLVPQGYFDGLASNILQRVKTDHLSAKEELESLSPLLSKLDKKTPLTIPVDYFENLTGGMLGGMKVIEDVHEELEILSPLLSTLKAVNVYEVPADYFETLPAKMLNKARERQPARVVSMTFRKKAVRYAAAAVVVAVIFTAGLLFMNRQNSVPSDTLVQNDAVIEKQTQSNVEGLSDDELVNFLDNQTAPLPDILSAAATAEIDSEDVKMMLADIPDAELRQYLEEYSDGNEVLTN